MNLFSAFLGALAVGVLFYFLRRQKLHLLAAGGGAITLALVPSFWQYATMAAVYPLNGLIAVLLFGCLSEWEMSQRTIWLWLAALLFGLGAATHPTFLLFAPATLLFVILVSGRRLMTQWRSSLVGIALAVTPGMLYLFFLLRGIQLFDNQFVLPNWPMRFAQGIISPYYENSLTGFLIFITGRNFIENIGIGWNWSALLSSWGDVVFHSVNLPIALVALIGVGWLGIRRKKLLIWALVAYFLFVLFALQYDNALRAIGDYTNCEPTAVLRSTLSLR